MTAPYPTSEECRSHRFHPYPTQEGDINSTASSTVSAPKKHNPILDHIKMQASLSFSAKLPLTPTRHLPTVPRRPLLPERTAFAPRIRVFAMAAPDSSTVDYSSPASVFPAEACETVGGDACAAEMYPEVKMKPAAAAPRARTSSEKVDREYVEYNEPKTVFPGEACDDLGGEFCDPEYQKGVY